MGHDLVSANAWSKLEVEAIVVDHFSMLASHLAGVPYNKTAHRRALRPRLDDRTDQSIEFKHGNISAVLIELGFPNIPGYRPRSNYQQLLAEVVAERLGEARHLHELAAADADRPIVVPEVDDILAVLTKAPEAAKRPREAREPEHWMARSTNYLEREARNRSLGLAGEEFVLNYERARLIHAGREKLAAKIEHTSVVRGDHEGYDILSFEDNGSERLIEVKTTKYGKDTPFFLSRNEVAVSGREAEHYFLYRMFAFRDAPGMYSLTGAMDKVCDLSATTFLAMPR